MQRTEDWKLPIKKEKPNPETGSNTDIREISKVKGQIHRGVETAKVVGDKRLRAGEMTV